MIEAICFDLGDTLVAEETVIHNSCGQAITARVIEGVFEVLEDYFDVIVISEEVGIEKPDKQVFQVALDKLGVEAQNAVMVGNRIDADIVGANRIGMKSVWFRWNDRYEEIIGSEEEKPGFIIKSLAELPGILSSI